MKINILTYVIVIPDEATERFKQALYDSDWVERETCDNPSKCYKLFLKNFLTIYENIFPRKNIKLKVKDIQRPWITSEIKKFSKRIQRLYEKCLKTRIQKSELEYKNHKNLFEAIKKHSKKLWEKKKITSNHFEKKYLWKKKEITDTKSIA